MPYTGPWDLSIRDFDPSLNVYFLKADTDPVIKTAENNSWALDDENASIETLTKWAEDVAPCIKDHEAALKVTDCNNNSWVYLSQKEDYENSIYRDQYKTGYSKGSQRLWIQSFACAIKKRDSKKFKAALSNANFWGSWFTMCPEAYSLFNMEYAWSQGYSYVYPSQWYDVEAERDAGISYEFDSLEKYAPLSYLSQWEGQYDGSINESISIWMPSKLLIDSLSLSQGQVNGHFYDKNGRLTIFDDESSGNVKGLLIREDALNAFLNSCDYDLIWVCQANKLFKVNAGRTEYVQSEWSGLYSYNNGNVNGKLNCMGVYPRDINK